MASIIVQTFDGKGKLIGTRNVPIPDEQVNEDTLHQRGLAALADLRPIANGNGNMNAAQLTGAVRAIAKVLVTILRLHLRRFDDTE